MVKKRYSGYAMENNASGAAASSPSLAVDIAQPLWRRHISSSRLRLRSSPPEAHPQRPPAQAISCARAVFQLPAPGRPRTATCDHLPNQLDVTTRDLSVWSAEIDTSYLRIQTCERMHVKNPAVVHPPCKRSIRPLLSTLLLTRTTHLQLTAVYTRL